MIVRRIDVAMSAIRLTDRLPRLHHLRRHRRRRLESKARDLLQYPEAFWAASTAWAAWFAILLNATGLYVVWRQLKANEDAVRDAGRSADAAAEAAVLARLATRPWIKVELGSSGHLFPTATGGRVNIPVTCTNVGETPAVNFFCYAEPLPIGIQPAALEQTISFAGTGPFPVRETLFPGQSKTENLQIELVGPLPDTGQMHQAVVYAFYATAGGGTRHQSIVITSFLASGPNSARFSESTTWPIDGLIT